MSRAIFFAMCILCTVDTRLFVYPSLSRSLLMSVCILSLSAASVFFLWARKTRFSPGILHGYVFLWIGYLLLHGLFIGAENYRLFYLAVSLLLVVTLSCLLEIGAIRWQHVENGLLLIAAIHIVCMVGQAVGLIPSGSPDFSLTGANENPSVTAIYLAACLPVMAGRLHRHPVAYGVLLTAAILCVAVLRCRTAYIGSVVIFLVLAVSRPAIREKLRKMGPSGLSILSLATVVLLVAGSSRLYLFKKESADGRKVIWSISARMLADKPQGHGYGLFEKNYNLRQADYFSKGQGTEAEKRHADFVAMPYNDFLEQGIEGGLPGMFFLLGFYALFALRAFRQRQRVPLSVILSFAAMSMTNFVYTSIQPWLLLVCHAALVASGDSPRQRLRPRPSVYPYACALFLAAVLGGLWHEARTVKAQALLCRYHRQIVAGRPEDSSALSALQPAIGTSELYWRTRAANHAYAKEYGIAVRCLENASRYTSSPSLFYQLYRYHQLAGTEAEGARYIAVLCGMLPHHLLPRILLMRHYAALGDRCRATAYAKEVSGMPVKVFSHEAESLKSEAIQYLEQNE